MNSEVNPHQHKNIVIITLAMASVINALCFYVFESVDAGIAGAGIVIALGFWYAAHIARDRDRAMGPRFSLAILLELFLAFALAFKGIQIVGSFDKYGEYPSAVPYLSFYGAKLLLSFAKKSRAALSVGARTRFSIVAAVYSLLLALAIWLTNDWPDHLFDAPLWLGFFLLFWFGAWFSVPTVTFFLDIRSPEGPTLRYAVWRSFLEILVLTPITYFIAKFVLAIVMLMISPTWY